jgi:hypothetical protein
MLPMRSLANGLKTEFPINRFGLISFHDKDHGDGSNQQQGGALNWLVNLLEQNNIHDADGEIWLQCYPRVLGYSFKPVSFWYCHKADNSLRAIVVEVNNTFGERHCYLLDAPRWGIELQASKLFHVSPFCDVQGSYRFRFMRTSQQIVARIEHDDLQGPLLKTSVSGVFSPATPNNCWSVFKSQPLASFALITYIHWQAFRLWIKKAPFHKKPAPPKEFVTH